MEDLPVDTLAEIMSHLEFHTLSRVAKTCKTLYNVVYRNSTFKTMYLRFRTIKAFKIQPMDTYSLHRELTIIIQSEYIRKLLRSDVYVRSRFECFIFFNTACLLNMNILASTIYANCKHLLEKNTTSSTVGQGPLNICCQQTDSIVYEILYNKIPPHLEYNLFGIEWDRVSTPMDVVEAIIPPPCLQKITSGEMLLERPKSPTRIT